MSQVFSWREWTRLGAVEISRRVRQKEVTAPEVAEQARAAARAVDPEIGALVELLESAATPRDVEPGSRRGQGLLAGVPLFLKDLGSSVAGLRRENGSALFRDVIVERTDPLLAAWLGEGAQVLGRATTAELGMAYDTTTVYRGLEITRNPWNPAYTAGGSSGGSAALVAAGVVPAAHATDGAGSIRLPAAFNGLVGLKVTRGRLPAPWGTNELSNTTWVEGVISRSLEDAALFLDAATRRAAPLGVGFVASGQRPTNALAALSEAPPLGLRIGVTTHAFGRADACGAEQVRAVRRVAEALSGRQRVEEVDPRLLPSFEALWSSFATFWAGIRAGSWRLRHGDLPPERLAELSPMVRRYWEESDRYEKADVLRYLAQNAETTRAFGRLFERYDLLLLPAFPYGVPLANGAFSPAADGDFGAFLERFLDGGRYTMPASEAGLPALTVPVGFDVQGLPLAVQLYAPWLQESELLRAGKLVTEAVPFKRITPAVHVTH